MIKSVYFTGPAGIIEGKLGSSHSAVDSNPDKNPPCVLILHPDPLAGGTMNNKVVYAAFNAFIKAGFNVLRFNFRGVGGSKGNKDDFTKSPESSGLADASAALDWMHNEYPGTSHYWIAGFSFGSWIASHLIMRRPEIEGFVLIAPPATNRDFNFLNPCPSSGIIIQPEKDTIAKIEHTNKLYSFLVNNSNSIIEYEVVPNADHFFQDALNKDEHYLDKLESIIYDYISVRLATRVSKPIRKKRRRRKKKEIEIEN